MLKANNNLFNQDFANLSQVAPISTTHEEPEATTVVHQPLSEHVLHSLTNFLNNPEKSGTDDLYDIVLTEVERPLFTKVMQHVKGNQTKAARLMGINRGTLRKKLKKYGLS